MIKYRKLEITIVKKKRIWCDVTVHRPEMPDLTTRVRKSSVEDLPVGEKASVNGWVEWTNNGYGSTSELLIYSDEQIAELKRAEAQELFERIRAYANEKEFIPKKDVEKLRWLAGHAYDDEISKLCHQINIQKWIHYFRNTLKRDGKIYERAVRELHAMECHEYDDEIETARKQCAEEKQRKYEEKQAAERKAGIVHLALPAYHGWAGKPQKGEVFEQDDRIYRTISSYYNKEDGFSFGAMNDEWYSVKAQDITNTPEGQERLSRKAAEKLKTSALAQCQTSMDNLVNAIQDAGSKYPEEGSCALDDIPGTKVFDSFNIYGSGFILKMDAVA